MLAIEQACLRALFELDQLETDWIGCIETRDPEAIAGAYRLLGHHMQATMQYIGIAGAITESELALKAVEIPSGHGVGTSDEFDSGHSVPIS